MNLDILNNEGLMFRGVHAAGPEKGEFFTGTKLRIEIGGEEPRQQRIRAPYPQTGEEVYQKCRPHPIYVCREVTAMTTEVADELRELLRAGIVTINYRTKEGEAVSVRGTLQEAYVKIYYTVFPPSDKRRRRSTTSITLWDLDAEVPADKAELPIPGWWSCLSLDRIEGYSMLITSPL